MKYSMCLKVGQYIIEERAFVGRRKFAQAAALEDKMKGREK
jgi:hypothetical protein